MLKKKIIEETEFYDMAHQIAELNGGSSFNCDLKEDLHILRDGDSIICLDNKGECEIKDLLRYYPSKKIKTYNVESFIKYAKQKI